MRSFNNQKYKNEKNERYMKTLARENINNNYTTVQNEKTDVKLGMNVYSKNNLKQQIIVLDSLDRDRNLFPSINEYVLRLSESIKNCVAMRLLRTEYVLNNSYSTILINNHEVPINIYKPLSSYLFLNGYSKIKIANESNLQAFHQMSPGIITLPSITNNILLDPYTYVFNPIEKRLKRFDVGLIDNQGKKVDIANGDESRLILTFTVFTL